MAAVTICNDFGAQKNKLWHCFHCFPIYLPWSDGTMILVVWMLSFKPTFSLSSFTFIKKPFSSSSLSAIRALSSAYLRLLIFYPAVLIPACASFSLAFCVIFPAYKLINRVTIYAPDGLLSQFGTRYVLVAHFVVIFKCSSLKKNILQHNFHTVLGLKICGREILGRLWW